MHTIIIIFRTLNFKSALLSIHSITEITAHTCRQVDQVHRYRDLVTPDNTAEVTTYHRSIPATLLYPEKYG